MENWQKEKIQINAGELHKNISCNHELVTSLVRQQLFSYADVQELISQRNNLAKCYTLLELLKTRTNGYDGLIQALRETRQSGALAILNESADFEEVTPRLALSEHEDISEQTSAIRFKGYLFQYGQLLKNPSVKAEAKEELLKEFYREFMKSLMGSFRNFSATVLEAFHVQTCNMMIQQTRKFCRELLEVVDLQLVLKREFRFIQDQQFSTLNGNVNFSDSPAIGIDLGTCNLCTAAYINGEINVFQNGLGDKTTPSYVSFDKDNTTTIGHEARQRICRNPEYTIYDSKRIIGRSYNDKVLQGDLPYWNFKVVDDNGTPKVIARNRTYTAEEISALLVMECKQQAEKVLNKTVDFAVVTVPAYFNDTQRKATIRAAEAANLKVEIITEPVAAAITFKHERQSSDSKQVLVFDIGGGTFDVAVVKIDQYDRIEVIASGGDTHLGGEDFDRLLMSHYDNEFEKEHGVSIKKFGSKLKQSKNISELKTQCEKAKKTLSTSNTASIYLDGPDFEIDITRQTFEEICMPQFKRMIEIVEQILKDKSLAKDEIDDILLVGGSTRIPKLQQMLKDFFNGKNLNHSVFQDHAVATGAAIKAAMLHGKKEAEKLKIKSVEDVLPFSVGIQCWKDGVSGYFSRVIKKNSKCPTKAVQIFHTHKDNQTQAAIKVFQGEQDCAKENFFLGTFWIDGIPRAAAGKESFQVEMEIDHQGILSVFAFHDRGQGCKRLTVKLMENSSIAAGMERLESYEVEETLSGL